MPNFFDKYPYTDFHELNLDWIIKTVKETVAEWAVTLTEWHNTQEEWQQLYDYVHDYFDNLDVQQEINNKLDQMALDGSLAAVAQPIIDAKVAQLLPGEVSDQIGPVVASQIGSVVAGQIGDVVSAQIAAPTAAAAAAWLQANVTQPTTPVIDTSLSIATAGADAHVTGMMFDSTIYNTIGVDDINGYPAEYIDKSYSSGYVNDSGYFVSAIIPVYQGDTVMVKNLLDADVTAKSKFLFFDKDGAFLGGVNLNSLPLDGSYQRSYVLTSGNVPNVAWMRYQDSMANIKKITLSSGALIPYRKIVFDKRYAGKISDITNILNYFDIVTLPPGNFNCGQCEILDGLELYGSGPSTVITYTATYTNPMLRLYDGNTCVIKDLTIQRLGSDVIPPGDTQYRAVAVKNMQNTLISNVTFKRFTGSAIICSYMYESTSNCNTLITGCFFIYNYRSIWLDTRAEFCVISDCHFYKNAFGIENDGGNNLITSCEFRENSIGIYMEGDSHPNDTHGSITGCTMAHNTFPIDFKNTNYGMMITGCNLFYGTIRLTYSKAALFNNCNIGDVTIKDEGTNFNKIMNGIMQGTISYVGSHTNLVIENCTDLDGIPYSA